MNLLNTSSNVSALIMSLLFPSPSKEYMGQLGLINWGFVTIEYPPAFSNERISPMFRLPLKPGCRISCSRHVYPDMSIWPVHIRPLPFLIIVNGNFFSSQISPKLWKLPSTVARFRFFIVLIFFICVMKLMNLETTVVPGSVNIIGYLSPLYLSANGLNTVSA